MVFALEAIQRGQTILRAMGLEMGEDHEEGWTFDYIVTAIELDAGEVSRLT